MGIWSEQEWYAVQNRNYSDWDNGSYDYNEAVEMLKEQGEGRIAVINDLTNCCLREIYYEDIF